jgi:hypothetical protein
LWYWGGSAKSCFPGVKVRPADRARRSHQKMATPRSVKRGVHWRCCSRLNHDLVCCCDLALGTGEGECGYMPVHTRFSLPLIPDSYPRPSPAHASKGKHWLSTSEGCGLSCRRAQSASGRPATSVDRRANCRSAWKDRCLKLA